MTHGVNASTVNVNKTHFPQHGRVDSNSSKETKAFLPWVVLIERLGAAIAGLGALYTNPSETLIGGMIGTLQLACQDKAWVGLSTRPKIVDSSVRSSILTLVPSMIVARNHFQDPSQPLSSMDQTMGSFSAGFLGYRAVRAIHGLACFGILGNSGMRKLAGD